MMCVICKTGETHPGVATVTLEREGATVVIKGVPARVCKNCGSLRDHGKAGILCCPSDRLLGNHQ
jgi:YgiT-type zinc finger domain-containing protein